MSNWMTSRSWIAARCREIRGAEGLAVVDTGTLMVALSNKSTLVLLKNTVLELPVEDPSRMEGAHAGHAGHKLIGIM